MRVGNGDQCVDSILQGLANADQDPGGEGNLQFSGEFERVESPLRLLVWRPAMGVELAVERLDHHALAWRNFSERKQLVAIERSRVGVR